MKPITNNRIWALLLLSSLPSACSSRLGAWKIVRLLPKDVRSCQRWGDQFGDILRLGGTLTSAKSSSLGLTGLITNELLLSWPFGSGRVLGRKTFKEIFSVEVEGRVS